MGTPITISSDSLEVCRELLDFSSSEMDQVPMSGDSTKSFRQRVSNTTPNAVQKVHNWMRGIKKTYQRKADSDSFSNKSNRTLDAMDASRFHTEHSFMFVRCNFDKDLPSKPNSPSGSLYNYCPPFYNYLETCNSIQAGENITLKNLNSTHKCNFVRSKSVNERNKSLIHFKSSKRRLVDHKQEDHSRFMYEALSHPGSPDSEKKQELCSYLQLMKPTDKKQVVMLQNRRSTRVKNLCIMQEKKELERKLKEEGKTPDGHVSDDEGYRFEFPKPHLILKEIIEDFDNLNTSWMKKVEQNTEEIQSMLNEPTEEKFLSAEDQEVASLLPNGRNGVLEFKVPKLIEDCLYTISDFDLVADRFVDMPLTDNIVPHRKLRSEFKKAISQLKTISPKKSKLISDIISSLRNRRLSRNLRSGSKPFKHRTVIKKKRSKVLHAKQKTAKVSQVLHNNNQEGSFHSPFVGDIMSKTEHVPFSKPVLSVNGTIFGEVEDYMNDIEFQGLSREHQRSLLESRFPLMVNCDRFSGCFTCPKVAAGKVECTKKLEIDLTDKAEPPYSLTMAHQVDVAANEFVENSHTDSDEEDIRLQEISESASAQQLIKNTLVKAATPENVIEKADLKCIPFNKTVEGKSLHRSLHTPKKKTDCTSREFQHSPQGWTPDSPSQRQKKYQHSIAFVRENGVVVKSFYVDYTLILCQELRVSFWTQTALGNVLGAQNMWIPKGTVPRLLMGNKCTFKESMEMVISTETNVAYLELWMKEHASDVRQRPVADVFAIVYFWKNRQNGLEKKALQLENINGFADDVQYSVLKNTPKIIVSWHSAGTDIGNKKTFVHCYHLATDYQTVANISEFESVEHYVSSLHNIEDCDGLVMGCGENKITLWNLEYGYVVATIAMTEIKSPLCTLWVKSDRGFLFTLQQCVDRELRLVAINGINHSWKKLASYVPPEQYDRLKGVCVENGIILGFYDQGILCWNAQTGEPIVEESQSETEYVSGKYVISIVNDQVNVRHAVTHLLSPEDS
ncbi:uncharacterized protein LOC132699717 [Cylas formicarius]|uniref:uncharacterized protein LOC132699717 n=1 Tax=Cylas formicarius TaxID=197179 RepID=UPI002958D5A8|nr:uncharacterized protein LOC132699717 [Cylas formicarius]